MNINVVPNIASFVFSGFVVVVGSRFNSKPRQGLNTVSESSFSVNPKI
jgi:hypothetical protein